MQGFVVALAALFFALLIPAQAGARHASRDVFVTSFDNTKLYAHFYPTPSGAKAPTVLVLPRWAFPGDTNPTGNTSDVIGASVLRQAGYNVVTADPRGFGRSGGVAQFDSPAFEGRDVQALVNYIANQPEAKLDAAGDPRVGMSGTSYGGGIQLIAAALDRRIDAIVPDIGWSFLPEAFFRDGAVKQMYPYFCAVALGQQVPGGVPLPPNRIAATIDGHIVDACNSANDTGTVSASDRQWFAEKGPAADVDRVRAPTLLLQGAIDPVFPPGQAIANYERLRRNNVPVKMVWYCGGHSTCKTGGEDPENLRRIALRWLNRWLRPNTAVRTGPAFEWVSDDGVWRTGPDYPLAPAGQLEAGGFGHLDIRDQSLEGGGPAYAIPGVDIVNATFGPMPRGALGYDIIGEPGLRLTYRGTATPAQTFVYAQIIDGRNDRVVGNQVTPVPVLLDGVGHEIVVPMEVIAAHASPDSILRVQITPSSPIYTSQRSVGRIDEMTVEAVLPIVDATRSGRPAG